MAAVTSRHHPLDVTLDDRSPITRVMRLAGAAVVLATVLGACTSSEPKLELASLEDYDRLSVEIIDRLEADGVVESDSLVLGTRGAQFENGECRVFARDAEGTTSTLQPSTDDVHDSVTPVLEQHGFEAPEQDEVEGGHLALTSTDERGARLDILWKASRLSVTVSGTADLEQSACTEDAVG